MKCTSFFFLCYVAYQNKKSEGSVCFRVMEPFCCQSGKNKLHCIPYEREQIPVALVALTRPPVIAIGFGPRKHNFRGKQGGNGIHKRQLKRFQPLILKGVRSITWFGVFWTPKPMQSCMVRSSVS